MRLNKKKIHEFLDSLDEDERNYLTDIITRDCPKYEECRESIMQEYEPIYNEGWI